MGLKPNGATYGLAMEVYHYSQHTANTILEATHTDQVLSFMKWTFQLLWSCFYLILFLKMYFFSMFSLYNMITC